MSDLSSPIRHDWSLKEIREIHDLPLFELIDRARAVHLACHKKEKVQLCTLLSVKTGGCPEDCAYCPQSSHHDTSVKGEAMLKLDEVMTAARAAKEHGATRFCMGAAWREVKDGPRLRPRAGHGPRREGPRARSLCHARHVERGQAAKLRRRLGRVQPQPRHLARKLQVDHLDSHLRRSFEDAEERAPRGHHRVLGWHHRRWARASTTAAACCSNSRSSSHTPRACR